MTFYNRKIKPRSQMTSVITLYRGGGWVWLTALSKEKCLQLSGNWICSIIPEFFLRFISVFSLFSGEMSPVLAKRTLSEIPVFCRWSYGWIWYAVLYVTRIQSHRCQGIKTFTLIIKLNLMNIIQFPYPYLSYQ